MTDTHDLETMIFSSEALDTLLKEFGESSVIKKLSLPVRSLLITAALPIGYLRWLSSPSQRNIGLTFKGISFAKFINRRNLDTDIYDLIMETKKISRTAIHPGVLKKEIQRLCCSGAHDPWQLCSGHDMVEILSIGLASIFGNCRTKGITKDSLDAILRLVYDYNNFCKTKLCNSMLTWEKANPVFKVLRST
jgi:hypothetical protein